VAGFPDRGDMRESNPGAAECWHHMVGREALCPCPTLRRTKRQTVSKHNVLVDYNTAHYHEKLFCSLGVVYLHGFYPRRAPPRSDPVP
jgi:hypothetical protein